MKRCARLLPVAILLLALAPIAPFRALAQDPVLVALSQKEAVRQFPALAKQGAPLNIRFLQRLNSLKIAHDSVLLRDDWPLIVTKEVAIEVGDDPVAPPPVAAPSPTATPTPWAPKGTALDTNVPAPDGASSLSPDANKKYFIYGEVIRKDDDGLLISCSAPHAFGYDSPIGEVWLTGRQSTLHHVVKTVAVKTGRHTFTTSGGFDRTVDEYKASD